MKTAIPFAALLLAAPLAWSKLPPLSGEAKAKAAEVAARNAHNDKIGAWQLCQSMDRVAARYLASAKQGGKETKVPTATPPCSDPGQFVYTPPSEKPLEAAGAHSPPGTALSPPNTTTPQSPTGAATTPAHSPPTGNATAAAPAAKKP